MVTPQMTERERMKGWLPFERECTRKALRWLLNQAQKTEQSEEVDFPFIRIENYPFDLEFVTGHGERDLHFLREDSAEQTYDLFATYLITEISSPPESKITHLRVVQIDSDQPHFPDERAVYYELGLSSKILMCRGVYSQNGGLNPDEDLMYALFMTLSKLFDHKISWDRVAAEQIRYFENTLHAA